MAKHQPAAVAAMEGLFASETGAGIVLMGQPDDERKRIDNPVVVNDVLSFLIYGTTRAEVTGLDQFPRDQMALAFRTCCFMRTPHHGRTGHVLRFADGAVRIHALARQALPQPLDAVASAFEFSTSLHRKYRDIDAAKWGIYQPLIVYA